MPCKHEGGTDTCEQYKSGHCKANISAYYAKHKQKIIADGKARHVAFRATQPPAASRQEVTRVGKASELIVAADLLRRGLEVAAPLVDIGDDWHVRCGAVWFSVQVRTASRDHPGLSAAGGFRQFSSDVVAVVRGHQIRYVAGRAQKVPKELVCET